LEEHSYADCQSSSCVLYGFGKLRHAGRERDFYERMANQRPAMLSLLQTCRRMYASNLSIGPHMLMNPDMPKPFQ
jgi:hypothetical protein